MVTRTNPAWAELLQLVPVVSLALPFILEGSVDLRRAGTGFLVAALLTLPVIAIIRIRRQLQNPILVGTALWLWLGAIAFNVPVEAVAEWLSQTQALGLFVAALAVGLVATFRWRYGYVACRTSDTLWIRRASFTLLGLTLATVVWAWVFRHDIRLGGGLPFIALNVARRVLHLRAPQAEPQPAA
jgi:hypothetical protein